MTPLALWAGLCLLAGGGTPPAQEVPLPPELHYALLAKALSFDRQLDRFGSELVIAVVYQEEYVQSNELRRGFLRAAETSPIRTIDQRPVRVLGIRLREGADLASELRARGADVAYLTPLRAVRVSDVVAAARSAGAAVASGVPEHRRAGVGMVLSARDRRPHLLIDLQASRRDGADYAAQLLRLAEVVGR